MFVVAPNEADLLAPYLTELAEAYDTFAVRYGYARRRRCGSRSSAHADFSVRTVGLAGLGALGVSFGSVLAMDAPSARKAGEFNWGSTAWHELAHAFTLGVTDHRVPRWFSEGISVFEERRGRPGWGQGPRWRSFLAALKPDTAAPGEPAQRRIRAAALSGGGRPRYYQASLSARWSWRRGAAGDPAMLVGYRDGGTTDGVFRKALGASPEEFDEEFDAWLRQRLAKQVEAIGGGEADGPFQREMTAGAAFLRAGQQAEAATRFEQGAGTCFPNTRRRTAPTRISPRSTWNGATPRRGGTAYAAHGAQRDQLRCERGAGRPAGKAGRPGGRAAALERAAWIDPRDQALHQKLAEMHGARGAWRQAARERAAVLALDPVDKAEALYQLAHAWNQAGDKAAARREVLKALEIAPSFEKAQELLLEIRR